MAVYNIEDKAIEFIETKGTDILEFAREVYNNYMDDASCDWWEYSKICDRFLCREDGPKCTDFSHEGRTAFRQAKLALLEKAIQEYLIPAIKAEIERQMKEEQE